MPTLSPPRFDNAQSFFTPTLKHTLRPARYNNAQVFFAPTVTQVAKLSFSVSAGRRGAIEPRLDVSRRAATHMRSRGRSRRLPGAYTEATRQERRESVTERQTLDSTSVGQQVANQEATPGTMGSFIVYWDQALNQIVYIPIPTSY